mgnify:CR=1 FL=1
MRFLIFLAAMTFLIQPFPVQAGKWSGYTTLETKKGVEISYRLREQKDGWFIEYKGSNSSKDWAKPVLTTRSYLCSDGKKQTADKSKSLGPLPPGESRASVRDAGICTGAQISSVNVSIEIHEVSENVKKMWE